MAVADEGVIFGESFAQRIRETVLWAEQQKRFAENPQRPSRQYPAQNIIFQNDSGETVPPYAAMEVTDVIGIGGRNILSIQKPTGDTNVMIVFNNHTEVKEGKNGVCHINGVIRALYSNGDGSNGTSYITKADSWELETGTRGFEAIGTIPNKDDQMLIIANPTSANINQGSGDGPGSGSEDPCYILDGIDMDDLPVLAAGFILGFSADGCLGKFPINDCKANSSASE